MQIVADGIVLRYVNYRDHDRMLTLLTSRDGLQTVLCQGCRRLKSQLLPCSEWLTCGQYEMIESHGRRTITACTIQDGFYPLRADINRLNCAACMTSLCEKVAQKGQNENRLYTLLMKGLYFLAYDSELNPYMTTAAFLLKVADVNGWRPVLKYCAQCGKQLMLEDGAVLDNLSGGLLCDHCIAKNSSIRLLKKQIVWICSVLKSDFEPHYESDDRILFVALRSYLETRLEEFIPAMHRLDAFFLENDRQ